MTKLLCMYFAFLVGIHSTAWSQDFAFHDHIPGRVAIDQPIDSILTYFGKPDRQDTLLADGPLKTYFYKIGLIVWADTLTGKVLSFDISSNDFTTEAGLRIGDPIAKVIRLYGEGDETDVISHAHSNYDYNFKDFDKIIYFQYGDETNVFFNAIYMKKGKVVHIHVYRSLGC